MRHTPLPWSRADAPRGRTRPRRKLVLESLERRDVPATFAPLAATPDGTAGSLRDAIIQADADGQDDVITLQAGTYQLAVANVAGAASPNTGDLDLTETGHTITIQGAGAGLTIIDGGKLDAVFAVSDNVTAALRDLTVRDGITSELGGGISNGGILALDRVIVEQNAVVGTGGADGTAQQYAERGVEAFGGGIYNYGTLTLTRSIVRKNKALGGTGGVGAAVTASSKVPEATAVVPGVAGSSTGAH